LLISGASSTSCSVALSSPLSLIRSDEDLLIMERSRDATFGRVAEAIIAGKRLDLSLGLGGSGGNSKFGSVMRSRAKGGLGRASSRDETAEPSRSGGALALLIFLFCVSSDGSSRTTSTSKYCASRGLLGLLPFDEVILGFLSPVGEGLVRRATTFVYSPLLKLISADTPSALCLRDIVPWLFALSRLADDDIDAASRSLALHSPGLAKTLLFLRGSGVDVPSDSIVVEAALCLEISLALLRTSDPR
jgi:hypothetical protein